MSVEWGSATDLIGDNIQLYAIVSNCFVQVLTQMKVLPLCVRFLSLANYLKFMSGFYPCCWSETFFPNSVLISLVFTLFDVFISSSHQVFFIFSLHISVSLVRQTSLLDLSFFSTYRFHVLGL